jgi:hypothetical protein
MHRLLVMRAAESAAHRDRAEVHEHSERKQGRCCVRDQRQDAFGRDPTIDAINASEKMTAPDKPA